MFLSEFVTLAAALTATASLLLAHGRRRAHTPDVAAHFQLTPATSAATLIYTLSLGPPRRIRLTQRPPQRQGPRIQRGLPLTIQPVPQPLWYEKGWRKVRGRDAYRGRFRAAGSTYRGEIVQPYAGHFEAYIWQPPLVELSRNTHHSACFTNGQRDGQYKVHFSLSPVSLDHAITSIEVVLEEALTGRSP